MTSPNEAGPRLPLIARSLFLLSDVFRIVGIAWLKASDAIFAFGHSTIPPDPWWR